MQEETRVSAQRRRTRAEIKQITAQFADSHLNRTEFCRRYEISLGALNRHLKRQRKDGDGKANHDGLIAVEVSGGKWTRAGCDLAVVLSTGRKIEVGTGFDERTLRRLIDVLERT